MDPGQEGRTLTVLKWHQLGASAPVEGLPERLIKDAAAAVT